MSLSYPPPYQDLRTLSEHICVGESTIENWVRLGLFPAPAKVGGKRLWEWKAVERHLAGRNQAVSASPDELSQGITNATRKATSASA